MLVIQRNRAIRTETGFIVFNDFAIGEAGEHVALAARQEKGWMCCKHQAKLATTKGGKILLECAVIAVAGI